MKKLTSLGCLLALVFAGASAFAEANEIWFDADFTTIGAAEHTTEWKSVPTNWDSTNKSFNDWTTPLTYRAGSAAELVSVDSTIITEVMFTPIDGTDTQEGELPEDLTAVSVEGAKAGLTIVQTGTATFQYYGLVQEKDPDDNTKWVPTWVPVGAALGACPAVPVTVKVALCKYDTGAIIKYSVDNVLLLPSDGKYISAGSVNSFQEVSYLGNCPLINSLAGNWYSNASDAKESINTGITGSKDIPETIQVSRTDLLERSIDPDNADAVVAYLTTKKTVAEGGNNQYGWVNVALGVDDDQIVGIASNVCAVGKVTLDYGFVPDGSSSISYVIDNTSKNNTEIDTTSSGIHTVKVQVKQGDVTVDVVTEQVGVMNTGKDTKDVPAGKKTFDIVAVPFASFKGNVTVANVLNTVELNVGDTLYILSDGKYDTFELKEGKVWKMLGETSYSREKTVVDEIAPENYTLEPGQAIWIERNANSKIVFAGVGETTANHYAAVLTGEYNLVANPTINAFDLSTAKCKFALDDADNWGDLEWENLGSVGDRIIVEDVAAPIQYEKTKDGWGSWVTQAKTDENGKVIKIRDHEVMETVFVPGGVIPAGIGFWYKNNGSKNLTIDFGTNATPTEP